MIRCFSIDINHTVISRAKLVTDTVYAVARGQDYWRAIIGGTVYAIADKKLPVTEYVMWTWVLISNAPATYAKRLITHTHKLHNIRVVLHTYCTYSFIDGSISAEYTIARYHWWSHCWWVWPFWRWGKLNWLWWKSNWWMVFDDVKVSRFGDGLGYVHRPKHGDGFLFKARLVLTCVQNAMDGMVWV